ncbi:hypothetical protein F1559_001912 [Cyanidiococcus yangmingshanensis]|uniref:Uncharacterized protein n=1 Tax=Cyanidiococcus yangmingshanensis TaxID=2690220 RepID=A0A7J7IFI4_9RHOD|nr:hypothetical protein F1559_001912 [Cyanidiococcus yangmingshanensis]
MSVREGPTLKFELHPTAAFVAEGKLRYYSLFNAVLSCISRVDGSSEVAFGLELVEFPYLRLQLTPKQRWSMRVPVWDLGRGRRVFLGTTGGLSGDPVEDQPELLVEGHHQMRLIDAVLDDKRRKAIQAALREQEETLRRLRSSVVRPYRGEIERP